MLALIGRWAVVGFAMVHALPVVAVAQDDDADARAHATFERARIAFLEGDYERALEGFERAYELSARPALLLNAASTLERLGRHREAAERIRRFLATDEDVAERDMLERRAESLEARAESDAGEQGSADGSAEPPVAESPPSREPDAAGPPVPAIIAFGVAGAALIAGGVLGGLALAENTAIEDGCHAMRSCEETDIAALETLSLAADVSFGVALAGAVTGLLLLLLVDDGGEETVDVAFGPTVLHGGAGIGISGALR